MASDYSNATPSVTFQYDRLGRQVSAFVDGVSTNLFAYDALDLVSETQHGFVVTRDTDALSRPAGFALDEGYAVSYAYAMFGRFHSVSPSAQSAVTFSYSYLPNTDLISGMTASSGFLWTRAYESAHSLITSVDNRCVALNILSFVAQDEKQVDLVPWSDPALVSSVVDGWGN